MNNCIFELEYEYVVLKINGNDISHLPRYEAVQMFLQTKETIVVELCRQKQNALDIEINIETRLENKVDSILPFDQSELATVEKLNTSPTTSASQNVKSTSLLIASPSPPLAPVSQANSKNDNQIILTLRALNNEESAVPPVEVFSAVSVSKETQTSAENLKEQDIVRTIADHFIEQEHHLFEQCLEPEIDIEEITLVKTIDDSTTEKLGINVCCNGYQASNIDISRGDVISDEAEADADADADADVCEDVFISDIEPEGIAQRDGRLRRGDQILRINGMDVKSKEEVEAQIAGSTFAVTLLVSRLLYPEDDDDEDIESNFEYANSFLRDDYTNVVDKLDKVLLSQVQTIKTLSVTTNEPVSNTTKNSSPTTQQNSDPNVNVRTYVPKVILETSEKACSKTKFRTDENLSHVKALNQFMNKSCQSHHPYEYDESEHIYETIPEDSESEPLYCSPYQSSNYMTAMGSCSSATATGIGGIETEAMETKMQQQTQRVAQWLGLKSQCHGHGSSSPRTMHTLVGRPAVLKSTQQPACSRVFTLRSTLTNTSRSSSSGAAHSACGPNNVDIGGHAMLGDEIDNSSSAYNTGGSNSASPHQNQISNAGDEAPISANQIGKMAESQNPPILSPKEAIVTTTASSMLMLPFESPPKACNEEENHQHKTDLKLMRIKPAEELQSHCPQFNAPNLSRYHFVSSQEVANKSHIAASSKHSSILISENGEEIPMVWKVKRRADGTRYIVKRPVRNRAHVAIRKNTRSNEFTTTEDDTVSEVKIGRYWTKEERKRHIERARERRHHQQQQ
ncbi:slo-interacting protein 1 isoform X2 [Drosophila obscura]|uniref:slo-interacting protein 1 isoform X2 n=1 Tax=Drosophila obscura TaxID=7282 RepID=UPI001BB11458|nr:slo-interacting protein 1 isoform X2 [Drosophila obscura]